MSLQKTKSYLLIGILMLWGLPPLLRGQLYINEFMASNSSVTEDPDYHDNSDWIEIYNDYSYDINLGGFYLTDNLDNPDKWRIEISIILPAKSYQLIWCDGRDSALHTSFKLAQEGEQIGLFSPGLSLVDSLTYIHQSTDISYGRIPDNYDQWAYFRQPTPGSENNTTAYADRVENTVEFSVFGGIYDSPFTVELSTYLGGTIRYTLDGSAPDGGSSVYSGPLTIGGTTIVRARVFKNGMIPGKVSTQSYFLDEDLLARKLPIVSIATEPGNFWDPDSGIYVQDFKPEWEIPVNIEFFENNGSDRAGFNELAGIKVNGLYSWQLPQKMLGVYFRKEYDQNNLDYPLLPDRPRTRFKSFALRASGSDWSYTLFRDGMIQNASQYNTDIDIQGFRACIVFVNGQYLGIHNIRDKVDESYIEGYYSIDGGSFDLVENEDYPESGNLNAYNHLLDLLDKNLSDEANFAAVEEVMDVNNFTDYVITEIYSQNTSINHNVMAWKPRENGKWKWILMDLDRGFFQPNSNMISFYRDQSVWPLRDLMENSDYVKYLGRRLADHLYTSYNPLRMHGYIDSFADHIEDEIPFHIDRWLGTTSSYGNAMPSVNYWYNEVNDLHDFAAERPGALLSDLQNYGFHSSAQLDLDVYPEEGGYILFNDLLVPGTHWNGHYPRNEKIILKAVEKAGYDFVGWSEAEQNTLVTQNDTWKYLDDGSNQGTAWYAVDYDDSGWQQGAGQLGYGDDDEETVVDYGGNSSNKYITTYFRKSFQVTSQEIPADNCLLYLLFDDGAVVYINGEEVVRANMPEGTITFQTTASTAVSSSAEDEYSVYSINPEQFSVGENVIAVEIHQYAASSSDISFDLELVLAYDYANIISNKPELEIELEGYSHLNAMFTENGQCILPDTIATDFTVTKACSPWVTRGDVFVDQNATLTIEAGAEVLMAENSNLYIEGKIQAEGTEEDKIYFRLNPDYSGSKWGGLCLRNTAGPSSLSWVTLKEASSGPDPITEVAAISAFHADLQMDHVVIDQVFGNPIAARYSNITLMNSQLHSQVTGDLINVKYGNARIENCLFMGNDQPDTDGIDYDDVENGIIRNCRIEKFLGFNSDAVDIGEKARNVLIDSLYIFNITDKGISVGQQSSANIYRSVFINCNLGLGLKDSCQVRVNQCTFYGNYIPVACFEKNPGSAGGNAIVRNSILSNSYSRSYWADDKSTLKIEYSITDNDEPPAGTGNIYDDPHFTLPDFADFELAPGSPCLLKGDLNGESIDLGAPVFPYHKPPDLMITSLFYNPWSDVTKSEFICLLNTGSARIDLYGYRITKAVEYLFGEHLYLYPGEKIYIVKNIQSPGSHYYSAQAVEWTEGNLANEGETIELVHPAGIILDQVTYSPDPPWPNAQASNSEVIRIINPGLDNHFGYNWTTQSYSEVFDPVDPEILDHSLVVAPNPSSGKFTIHSPSDPLADYQVFSLTGSVLITGQLDPNGYQEVDLSMLQNGVYILSIGNSNCKIILSR